MSFIYIIVKLMQKRGHNIFILKIPKIIDYAKMGYKL